IPQNAKPLPLLVVDKLAAAPMRLREAVVIEKPTESHPDINGKITIQFTTANGKARRRRVDMPVREDYMAPWYYVAFPFAFGADLAITPPALVVYCYKLTQLKTAPH